MGLLNTSEVKNLGREVALDSGQRADLRAEEAYYKNRIKFSKIFENLENFLQFFK
jgi:hypothetical protein